VAELRESRDPAALARARAFLRRLDVEVPTVDAPPPDDLPEDPVLLVEPVVEASACHVDPATGQSCRSFHRPRTWFRILGTMGGTIGHRALYERALAPVLREGARPRIWVPATADHSLFAVLHWLAERAGARPEILVSDLCPTPLAVTRWYASHVGAEVETVQADALRFDGHGHGPFDAICVHFFLGWLPPEQREGLLRRWRSLLRPGGRVVTSANVREGSSPPPPRRKREFRPGQLEAFEATARERAHHWKDFLGADPEEVGAAAKVFLPTWRSRQPQESVGSMAALFDRAGFDLEMDLHEPRKLQTPHWNPAPELESHPRRGRLQSSLVAVRRG
jgi:SAM-dependent methyltransferase